MSSRLSLWALHVVATWTLASTYDISPILGVLACLVELSTLRLDSLDPAPSVLDSRLVTRHFIRHIEKYLWVIHSLLFLVVCNDDPGTEGILALVKFHDLLDRVWSLNQLMFIQELINMLDLRVCMITFVIQIIHLLIVHGNLNLWVSLIDQVLDLAQLWAHQVATYVWLKLNFSDKALYQGLLVNTRIANQLLNDGVIHAIVNLVKLLIGVSNY